MPPLTVIIQMHTNEVPPTPKPSFELLPFDSLPTTPPLTPQLLQHMLLLLKSQSWGDSFNVITALRSINRFTPQLGPQAVQQFITHLGEELHNGRPLIVKNALLLIQQIFARGRQVNVESCVVFVPYLLKKSVQTGSFKMLASEALTQFVLNCGYSTSFKVVLQCCHDKNPQISEMSVKVLAKLIETIGQNIVNLDPETLKQLMMSLYALLDGKRPNMTTFGYEICMFIFNVLGSQNYVQLMNYSLQPAEVGKMMSIMNEKQNAKSKQGMKSVRKSVVVRNKENTAYYSN